MRTASSCWRRRNPPGPCCRHTSLPWTCRCLPKTCCCHRSCPPGSCCRHRSPRGPSCWRRPRPPDSPGPAPGRRTPAPRPAWSRQPPRQTEELRISCSSNDLQKRNDPAKDLIEGTCTARCRAGLPTRAGLHQTHLWSQRSPRHYRSVGKIFYRYVPVDSRARRPQHDDGPAMAQGGLPPRLPHTPVPVACRPLPAQSCMQFLLYTHTRCIPTCFISILTKIIQTLIFTS